MSVNREDLMQFLGKKIKYIREEKRISKEKLAKKINTSSEVIEKIENGVENENFFEIVQKTCGIFNIDFLGLLNEYFMTINKNRKNDLNNKINQLILTASIFGIKFKTTKKMDNLFAKCYDLSETIRNEKDDKSKKELKEKLKKLSDEYLVLWKNNNIEYIKFINEHNIFDRK